MIYIDKTEAPETYTNFIRDYDNEINRRINGRRQKGSQMWLWFKRRFAEEYTALKQRLLEDQGSVCCYCGERIRSATAAIEHLEPKSNKENVFPFENLYATCNGGKAIQITLGNADNLHLISEKYNIEQQKLLNQNPGKSFLPGELVKILNADLNGDYCNHKKGEVTLHQSPRDEDIFNHIKYQFNKTFDEVEILPVDSNNLNLLTDLNDTLNLNQKTLKEKRAIHLNRITKLLIEIVDSQNNVEQKLTDLINSYFVKNRGKFEPFYFVYMSYINAQKEKLKAKNNL